MKKTNKVLLLDQSYRAIKAITWQRALVLFYLEKAEVIKYRDDWTVNSATEAHKVPSIVRLIKNTRIKTSKIKFSRTNIYKRDAFKCMYCGNKFHDHELTLDHVVPKSKGGGTSWVNVVSSCFPCNSQKKNRTPQQANMRLLEQPKYPGNNFSGASIIKFYIDDIPEEWNMWLGE